ncbi:Uma2 family endonuclease [Streptomyces sp. OF8]|uniref:Uma2 family endonuclease n=1 Tax=Streptomyces alkaliterrae TaxID=2213162 RepID=A0A5P0YWE0_9ACTN|nr:Uma2 family endonuclease [Streptomyces alkaliterrae]MQS03812.1 Uma2 family endonuclease [Streptomyces alkaliterrae]
MPPFPPGSGGIRVSSRHVGAGSRIASVEEAATADTESSTSWPVPPQDGWTVDDLYSLPSLPPHTEMIDGGFVFMSPRRMFHSLAVDLLGDGLRQSVPECFRVRREMNIVLTPKTAPEPDLLVLHAEACRERDETRYEAADAVLVVEVVSPESEERDRDTKPSKYARAGIPHFWRVEKGNGRRPVVYVYELDPATRVYALTGIHHDHLKLSVPFDINIDLTAIDHL